MTLQKLYSYTRQAIDGYSMIEDGDVIAIGISGGKDSLALLYALQGLSHFYPRKFMIKAITIDLGFGIQDLNQIQKLCESMDVEYHIVETEISDIVFDRRREANPCSLCAKMRKGALNDKALEIGCNKIAYAHHRDDVIETMMLSLIFEGRLHTFSPVTFLERTGLTLIRPFILIPEADIIGFQHKYNLPVAKGKCPADGYTKRQYVKELLQQIQKENPGSKDRMLTAILNSHMEGWNYGGQEKLS